MKAYITIKFKQPVVREAVDLGGFLISHSSGRRYQLDVDQSWGGDDDYTIETRASEDWETFPRDLDDDLYDIDMEDIYSREVTAELYVECTDDNEVESITYTLTDNLGNIHAENLTGEQE